VAPVKDIVAIVSRLLCYPVSLDHDWSSCIDRQLEHELKIIQLLGRKVGKKHSVLLVPILERDDDVIAGLDRGIVFEIRSNTDWWIAHKSDRLAMGVQQGEHVVAHLLCYAWRYTPESWRPSHVTFPSRVRSSAGLVMPGLA